MGREKGRESGVGLTPVRLGTQSRDLGGPGFQASDDLLAELEVPGGPPGTGEHQEGELRAEPRDHQLGFRLFLLWEGNLRFEEESDI